MSCGIHEVKTSFMVEGGSTEWAVADVRASELVIAKKLFGGNPANFLSGGCTWSWITGRIAFSLIHVSESGVNISRTLRAPRQVL